jgi:hypothetical protein
MKIIVGGGLFGLDLDDCIEMCNVVSGLEALVDFLDIKKS